MVKPQAVVTQYDGIPFGATVWSTYWDREVHQCTVVGVHLKGNEADSYDLRTVIDGQEHCFMADPECIFDNEYDARADQYENVSNMKASHERLLEQDNVTLHEIQIKMLELEGKRGHDGKEATAE